MKLNDITIIILGLSVLIISFTVLRQQSQIDDIKANVAHQARFNSSQIDLNDQQVKFNSLIINKLK